MKKTTSNLSTQADLNKRFGAGAFYTFEDDGMFQHVEICPSGIPSLDYAMGIGGFPMGRIIEIYGPESSGKTTLSLYIAAHFQKLASNPDHSFFNKRVVYLDVEHALDPTHVKALGVDCSKKNGMLVTQPDSGEDAFNIMEALCHEGNIGMVIVDSVAALVPMKETENDMSYNPIGLQARMMSQGLRKLKGLAYKNNVMFVFINQLRMKIGVIHGNPETTPGGNALKFYCSVRMDVRRQKIEKNGVHLGQTINVKIVKNKVSRPFTTASFDYYWDTGIDVLKDITGIACDLDIIKRAGAYYYLGESAKNPDVDDQGQPYKWQGKESLIESLRMSPDFFDFISKQVMNHLHTKYEKAKENVEESVEELQQPEEMHLGF